MSGHVIIMSIFTLTLYQNANAQACKDAHYCRLLGKSDCARSALVKEECKLLCGGYKINLVIHCPDIKTILNGDIKYNPSRSQHQVGTVATFTCDVGFKGVGKARVTCLENGKWSDKAPICRTQTCVRDMGKIEKGRKCSRRCRRDRQCKGTFDTCQCDDWCGKTCFNPNAECPKLPNPENGFITERGSTIGHSVIYGCNDGFTLTGQSRRKCRSDRRWSGYAPVCVPFSACGQSGGGGGSLRTGKVTKGKDAKKGAWPWQALLIESKQYRINQIYGSRTVLGGGSVINAEWILSAAHIFTAHFRRNLKSNVWNDTFHIIVGMTAFPRQGLEIPNHIQIYDPETVLLHPNFDLPTFDYDVSLIRVGKRLTAVDNERFIADENADGGNILFSRFVRPVCLPCMNGNPVYSDYIIGKFDEGSCNSSDKRNSFSPAGRSAMVTGFGIEYYGSNKYPDNLQEGRLRIVDRLKCAKTIQDIQRADYHARFTDRMLCASGGNKTDKIDSCQGDSGGPLVVQVDENHKTNYWMLVGIVSWGVKCGEKHPGFYVSVSSVMNWISKIVNHTTEVNCNEVILPKHHHYDVDSCPARPIGSHCSIKCDRGYRFSNETNVWIAKCIVPSSNLAKAQWDLTTAPECKELLCQEKIFSVTDHYNITACPSGKAVGSKCPITCKSGYKFSESVNSWTALCTLTSDSTSAEWEMENAPSCEEIKCQEIYFPNSKHYNMTSCPGNSVGTSCSIACKNSFKFLSKTSTKTFAVKCVLKASNDLEAHWEMENIPVCKPIKSTCQNWHLHDNQRFGKGKCEQATALYVNDTCRVQCTNNYKFTGTNRKYYFIRCRWNEDSKSTHWSRKSIPHCRAITCGRKLIPNRYMLNTTSCPSGTTVGSNCSVQCRKGYIFSNKQQIWTSSCKLRQKHAFTAEWDFTGKPTCKESHPCDLNPCENNGSCRKFGSTYKCICKFGYVGRNCRTGAWNDWSSWSDCSATCGSGKQQRRRTCKTQGKCPSNSVETRKCNVAECFGTWSEWTKWTKCSLSCGRGEQSRTRICEGTNKCPGTYKNTKHCNDQACTEFWNAWTSWTKCTLTCGGGHQIRIRTCRRAMKCKGNRRELEKCNTKHCPGSWSSWTNWSKCNKSCGNGHQFRARRCRGKGKCTGNEKQSQQCNNQTCPGSWTIWSEWMKCSSSCGNGERSRTRSCEGEGKCTGNEKRSQQCNNQACPGSWTNWSKWTECNASCGTGNRIKTRYCKGGGECIGNSNESQQCNNGTCPGSWSPWTKWSKCSASCGSGNQSKFRSCEGEGKCIGNATRSQPCNNQLCPGSWAVWSKWTECSASCGMGKKSRTRGCEGAGKCIGKTKDIQKCGNLTCPGSWGSWSKWTKCDRTCGGGHQSKSRTCQSDGECPGKARTTQECNTVKCPAEWTSWSNWSKCSRSCDSGQQSRARLCSEPGKCTGEAKDSRRCKRPSCPTWSSWSNWEKCSRSCNGGFQGRKRTCKAEGKCIGRSAVKRKCNTKICLDPWNNWEKWSGCSERCGGGERTRTRSCRSPGECSGKIKHTERCNTRKCVWSVWSKWSVCSRSCGKGKQSRTRSCPRRRKCIGNAQDTKICRRTCPKTWSTWSEWVGCSSMSDCKYMRRSRLCKGIKCPGYAMESRKCDIMYCIKQMASAQGVSFWSVWASWGSCSATCGAGKRSRQRSCIGITSCLGNSVETSSCTKSTCSEGHWSQWSPWSSCSSPCGAGTITRTRTCYGGETCNGSARTILTCFVEPCLSSSHSSRVVFVPPSGRTNWFIT